MEMTIGTDTVVMLPELLSALGVIGGVVLWGLLLPLHEVWI